MLNYIIPKTEIYIFFLRLMGFCKFQKRKDQVLIEGLPLEDALPRIRLAFHDNEFINKTHWQPEVLQDVVQVLAQCGANLENYENVPDQWKPRKEISK
jgi:hypothetical protein